MALETFLYDLINKELEKVEMGFVAKIITFDKVEMRAEIKPMLRAKIEEDGADNPKLIDAPNLTNVVVQMLFAGGVYIRPHYKVNDLVWVTCAASSPSQPIDSDIRTDTLKDRFALNYCSVIAGIIPRQFTPPTSWGLLNGLLIGTGDDNFIQIEEGSNIKIKGDLDIDGDVNVLGTIDGTTITGSVDVLSGPLGISGIAHTHTETGTVTGPPM